MTPSRTQLVDARMSHKGGMGYSDVQLGKRDKQSLVWCPLHIHI